MSATNPSALAVGRNGAAAWRSEGKRCFGWADAETDTVRRLAPGFCLLASLDIAIGKAYTAVAMKMSTADLAHVVQPGQPLYHLEIANQPRPLVAFGGGIPPQANGEVVGGRQF